MTDQAESRTAEESEDTTLRFIGFATLLTLGMPIAILTANYTLGWQAAVLLFPLLAMTLSSIGAGHRARPTRWLRLTMTLAILFGIPLVAVSSDRPEIMRLWAYATAIPFAFLFSRRGLVKAGKLALKARSATYAASLSNMLGPLLFLIGSEAIWLWTSMDMWIWYHAFSVPILIILTASVIWIADRKLPAKPSNIIDAKPPPGDPADRSRKAYAALSKQPSGEQYRYQEISLSQFNALFAKTDWSGGEVAVSDTGQVKDGGPETWFKVMFAKGQLIVTRDGNRTATVFWSYFEPVKWRVLGDLRFHSASKVPLDLVEEVIATIWDARWSDAAQQVEAYSNPFEPLS